MQNINILPVKGFLLIVVLFLQPLGAEDENDDRIFRLNSKSEDFFITATRYQREVATLPAFVTVIDRDDIERSNAQIMSDLFKFEAGVEVRENFGHVGSTSVDIRGFGSVASANTLILVDGRRLNRSDLGNINFTAIPLNRIEKVELYRGGRSVLYGDNATGGVINIITKKGNSEGTTLRLQSEFGSNESYRFGANLDGRVGKTSYSLDSSYYDTNGFREQNHERVKSAGFSVLIQELEDWDFHIAGGLSQYTIGTPSGRTAGMDRNKASRPEDYIEFRERYLMISPRYWFTENANLEITLSRREGDSDSFLTEKKQNRFQIYDTTVSPKLTIVSDFGEVSNTFISGFDWTHSKSTFKNKERNRRSLGYYIYNTMGFFDDTVFLDAGYRRERTKINITRTDELFSPENMDAYTAGLTWNYSEGSKIYASFDRSFRFQRVDELGGSGFDESLPPQDTKTYQAGIEHRFNRYLTLSANYYVIETENEIFYDDTAYQNTSYGQTSREGFELEAKVYPCDNLMLYVNYTEFDGRLLDDDLTNDVNHGNKIPGIPERKGSAGFSLDFLERFNLTAGGRWIDSYVIGSDYANSKSGENGHIVWDGRLTWTWEWLQIYGGVSNIFDENYNHNRTSFGVYPAPGREFFGGINLTFEL